MRVVSKQEMKAEERAEFTIRCKGVSQDEFDELRRALSDQFDCKVALKNPFVPQFDVNNVHEIIAHVTGSAIGGYAAKKVVDAAEKLIPFGTVIITPVNAAHGKNMRVNYPCKRGGKQATRTRRPSN